MTMKAWSAPVTRKVDLSVEVEDSGIGHTDITIFHNDVVVIANRFTPTKDRRRKPWMEMVVLNAEEMERLIAAWRQSHPLPDSRDEEK